MNRFFSAELIIPVSGSTVRHGVVETDENGTIVQMYRNPDVVKKGSKIETYPGIIVPGFVNTHCHLELSHLHNQISRQKGIVPFIQEVMKKRNDQKEIITEAMRSADRLMEKNGIVAVGDHANTTDSLAVKKDSSIQYHTFIELLGMQPDAAKNIYQEAQIKKEAYRSAGLEAYVTPHAGYSVSKELFKILKKEENIDQMPLSIHNQESQEENLLFKNKTGKFLDFYKVIGYDINNFQTYNHTSLGRIAPLLPRKRKILLVHNTFVSLKDINLMERLGLDMYWCFCPNANLYIEGQLPPIRYFDNMTRNITIGTDSLASNANLSVLDELKTLHTRFPELNIERLIQWATLNGAEYLGISNQFGSLDIGKKPGLVLIQNVYENRLTPESFCRRLI